MNVPQSLTALVLAGTRVGGDALAAAAGVSHKALIDIAGEPMLARVLRALQATPAVARIVVAIEDPALLDALPGGAKQVSARHAAAGPSASVALALQEEGTPLLVTTADHALLEPDWISEFLAAAPAGADMAVALARRESVHAALPETLRTYLHFADGDFSGCNLFLLRTAAAGAVVRLWQAMEADRKRPLALVQRLGISYALRYRLGRLTLAQALARLGELAGAQLAAVTLSDGRAALDVDKPEDLALVRRLLAQRSL